MPLSPLLHADRHVHGRCLFTQPRNIVRVGERWKLIDLDATVRIGEHVGVKRSTGYDGPELQRLDGALLPGASPTFDVWGLVLSS